MRRNVLARLGAAVAVGVAVGVTPATASGATEAGPAAGHGVTVEVLPGLGGGWDRPHAINDRGQVVGASRAPGGGERAVLWDDGEVTDLSPDGAGHRPGTGHYAQAINERGVVTGFTADGSGVLAGWVRADGATHALPAIDGYARPDGLNDRGQVLYSAGQFQGARATRLWDDGDVVTAPAAPDGRMIHGLDVNRHGGVAGFAGSLYQADAYLWRPGRAPVALGHVAGGVAALAVAINDRGDVVGTDYVPGDGYTARAFLWRDGRMVDLGTLGGASASIGLLHGAMSPVNAHGHVVGNSRTSDGETHAFLWRDGLMTDLGTLGGAYSNALGINDRGQVVGTSTTADGERRAFLWQSGQMTDLEEVVGHDFGVADLNNRGQVTGFGGPGTESRGYVVHVPPGPAA